MSNNWNIPDQLEKEVRLRDTSCVYCGVKFKKNFRAGASWEHINNRAKDIEKWNIVLCCRSCNSSKGAKNISDWLKSQYCMDNNINSHTVATIIKSYIKTHK
ncbi:MAG: HNH endonuclease [Candidatus Pacebacteria bacterium]|nr:HNH endonuclease [Candidatus Paceibacterota bacterium]